MVSTCCIIFTPFSLAVIAMVKTAVLSDHSNNMNLSKRIIALASGVVYAVIRIGPLDFEKVTR